MIEIKQLSEDQKNAYLEEMNKILNLEELKIQFSGEMAELKADFNEDKDGIQKRIDDAKASISEIWETIKTGQIGMDLFNNDEGQLKDVETGKAVDLKSKT